MAPLSFLGHIPVLMRSLVALAVKEWVGTHTEVTKIPRLAARCFD